ncbi:hypothetical protein [Spelaeicoccus albus]|uniref:hypothetical protein n=1 Tax=Spelaeicoccus albus TaxID=1280376 RepID=UPI0015C74E85|nr:hypothetical protein [Spelaeicoccus albus]
MVLWPQANNSSLDEGTQPTGTTRIRDLFGVLWPNGDISMSRSFGRVAHRGAVSFGVVPSLARPRLVLPLSSVRATSAAIRNYKASATGRRLLKVRIATFAARAGLAHLFADKVSVRPGNGGIDEFLEKVLGEPVNLSLYIGPERAVQKPIVQVLSSRGQTIAFSKVAVNELTASLINNEIWSIDTVRNADLPHLSAPRIINCEKWNDRPVVVQAAVRPGKSEQRLSTLLPDATRELTSVAGLIKAEWNLSEYRRTLCARIANLEPSGLHDKLQSAIDEFDEVMIGRILTFGAWHGDWARWNMTTSASGDRIVAWDWEHFERGVPAGFDAVHFDISDAVVVEKLSPVDAIARLLRQSDNSLARTCVIESDFVAVVCSYLLEIATRYLEQDEVSKADSPMSRLGEWFAKAVDGAIAALRGKISDG